LLIGHPDSPPYRDLAQTWLDGEYSRCSTRAAVERATNSASISCPNR
jgi:hypothetical protein